MGDCIDTNIDMFWETSVDFLSKKCSFAIFPLI